MPFSAARPYNDATGERGEPVALLISSIGSSDPLE